MKLTIFGIGGLPEFVAGDDLAQIIGDAVSLGTVSTGAIRVPNLSTQSIPVQRGGSGGEVSTGSTRETGSTSETVSTGSTRETGSTSETVSTSSTRETGSTSGGGGGREPEGSILHDGDILAVTSKIVSKAEGRQVVAADREDAITAETVRVVATRGHTRIVENRLGLVLAAAGVDASNTPDGTVLLLPVDPDATAHELASTLRARLGVRIGIIITDTIGRPWRNGQVDIAIGAAGIRVLDDLRGTLDTNGRPMDVTVQATADELASAADLIKGKTTGMPVAVIRGLGHLVGELTEPGARSVVRPSDEDLFRLGSREAYEAGYRAGLAAQTARDG